MDEFSLLDRLTGPEDLKGMGSDDLRRLADELRQGLIHTISRVGGHFAPNLGVIELTVALYKAFNLPHDKVIWDVGHQSYPHKMLTGRWKNLATIKQYGGISGFLRRDESPTTSGARVTLRPRFPPLSALPRPATCAGPMSASLP